MRRPPESREYHLVNVHDVQGDEPWNVVPLASGLLVHPMFVVEKITCLRISSELPRQGVVGLMKTTIESSFCLKLRRDLKVVDDSPVDDVNPEAPRSSFLPHSTSLSVISADFENTV
jgi:hypothetical protein